MVSCDPTSLSDGATERQDHGGDDPDGQHPPGVPLDTIGQPGEVHPSSSGDWHDGRAFGTNPRAWSRAMDGSSEVSMISDPPGRARTGRGQHPEEDLLEDRFT